MNEELLDSTQRMLEIAGQVHMVLGVVLGVVLVVLIVRSYRRAIRERAMFEDHDRAA